MAAHKWIQGNLVRRLVAPYFLLSIIAFFMVGVFSYTYVRQIVITATHECLADSLELHGSKLRQWVSDQEKSLTFLSRIPHYHENRAAPLLSETLRDDKKEGREHLSELLRFYASNHPGVREILLLSGSTGHILASSRQENAEAEEYVAPYWRHGKEVYSSPETGQPTIAIRVPFWSRIGQHAGGLIAHLDLDHMAQKMLGHVKAWKTGEIYIVDRQNRMISARELNHPEFLGEVDSEGIRKALQGKEGLGLYQNYAGIPVVGAYYWLPELNVALLAEVDQVEIFTPARQFGLMILGIGFCLTGLLFFGNLVAARRIIAPLRELSRMSAKVAAGDLTAKVAVREQDETGVLAESFNLMVDRLEQLYGELKTNATHFSTVFQLSPDSIAVMNFETGVFTDVNESFSRLFGFLREEAIGRPVDDLNIWKGKNDRLRLMAKLKKHAVVQNLDMTFCRRHGVDFEVLLSARLVELNGVLSVIAVLWDVSDLHRVEEELRSSKERLQLLIDRMPIGCIVWNTKFEVELWNPMAEAIFGFTSLEAQGRHANDLIVPEEIVPRVEWIYQGLLNGDATVRNENANITKGGRTIICDWHNTPLRDQSGTGIGAISMVWDVTEQKNAENELERYRQNLEGLVSERTRQLENAQSELLEKERLAVLGQLTATVSHELRNPLGTVSNAIFSLQDAIDKGQNERVARALALASRNVHRCDGIITELLDYTRSHNLIKESIDLGPWLDQVLEDQQVPRYVDLERDLAPGMMVSVDAERLRRAVVNVLENAVQALEGDWGRMGVVSVSLRAKDGRIGVDIVDNGPGIAEDVMMRIYEPLFSTKGFGVGLGMSVVKNVIEDHCGEVEVYSTPGCGTTVTLWLPVFQKGGDDATDPDRRG